MIIKNRIFIPLINELLKNYINILELIYIGILTFVREKKYKEAYDLGINYYNKKITPKIYGFTYYYDLYTFKYDFIFLTLYIFVYIFYIYLNNLYYYLYYQNYLLFLYYHNNL